MHFFLITKMANFHELHIITGAGKFLLVCYEAYMHKKGLAFNAIHADMVEPLGKDSHILP